MLDGRRLVFVDKMGSHTSLAPLYAYSPRGKRAIFKVPRNRVKNTTLLASISCEGMGPSMAFDRPANGCTLSMTRAALLAHDYSPLKDEHYS
jgi:hypothetical protein